MTTTAQYKSLDSLAEFFEKCPRFGEAVESMAARVGTDRAVVAAHAAILASNFVSISQVARVTSGLPIEVFAHVADSMKMFMVHAAGVNHGDFVVLAKLLRTDADQLVRQL
jgi:hypothetical protein